MNHSQEKFYFQNNSGKKTEFLTKPYCFKLEDVFIELVGKEKFSEYQQKSNVDLDLSLEKIEKYFPKLLDPVDKKFSWKSVNWSEQEYDNILDVVTFFLDYRKNALLRRLESEKETVASLLQTIQTITNSDLPSLLKPKG